MKRDEYLRRAHEALSSGRVNEEVYDSMIMNVGVFCEEDEDDLPDGYIEVEYDDFDNAEAIDGSRWDDKNYQHYTER